MDWGVDWSGGHTDGANGPHCGAAFALSVSGGERRGEDGRRCGRTGERGWRAGKGGQLGGVQRCPLGHPHTPGPGLLGRPDERDVAERERQPPPGGGPQRQGPQGRPDLLPRGSGGEQLCQSPNGVHIRKFVFLRLKKCFSIG